MCLLSTQEAHCDVTLIVRFTCGLTNQISGIRRSIWLCRILWIINSFFKMSGFAGNWFPKIVHELQEVVEITFQIEKKYELSSLRKGFTMLGKIKVIL